MKFIKFYLGTFLLIVFTSCNSMNDEVINSILQNDKKKLLSLISANNVNSKNKDGLTYLMIASISGREEILNLLIESDADLNALDNDNWTALAHATYHGNKNCIKLLIDKGADPNYVANNAYPPIFISIEIRDKNTLNFLLKNGANPNINKNSRPPLIRAIFQEDIDSVDLLIEFGANVNYNSKSNHSVLSSAVLKGNSEIIEKLLRNKANPNIEMGSRNKETAVFWAAKHHEIDTLKLLIKYGANLNILNSKGLTALDVTPHKDVQKILRQNGAKKAGELRTEPGNSGRFK